MSETAGPAEPHGLGIVDSHLEAEYRRNGWWTGERLCDRYRRLVEADPTRRALVDDRGVDLSRRELWERAGAVSATLEQTGVRGGDVIAIYLPNTATWQVAFLAALRLGAVPATIPATTDAATLRHIYDVVAARCVIAAEEHRGRPTGQWAWDSAKATGRAATVCTVDEDGVETVTRLDGADFEPIVPEGVHQLMFTSSTTGLPKAVMHTDDTLGAVNHAFAERFGVTADTPIFMPSPLGHSVGTWHGARFSLFTGATLVLQDEWDPVRALVLVEAYGCAFTAAATPFLKDLVDAPWQGPEPKLASLRTFLCGGAPVPPSLIEAAASQTPHTFVTVLWGMTEGTGTTCTEASSAEQRIETAGIPVPTLELRIGEPDGSGSGELAMRGAGVFVGYLGQEDLYRSLVTPDGWFRTGDLARIDSDGYLRLTGRLKDIIIRGGVNIAPTPIEDAIAAHPAVRRVAVIGQHDERLGERICAVIVAKGEPPTLEELVAWLTDQGVSTRKLPEALVVVPDMPVTAAGKIRKDDLRRDLEESA